MYCVADRDDSTELEELAESELKVKRVRFEEKLSIQGFHYGIYTRFEPSTKNFMKTSQELLEE